MIRPRGEIAMKGKDVVHEPDFELLDITAVVFSNDKFSPGGKEIFDGSDSVAAMSELLASHDGNSTLVPRLLPVLEKLKGAYLLWYGYYPLLPKIHRYSLGQRIDTLFVAVLEAVSLPGFLPRDEKQPYVRLCLRKTDALKILVMVLWETKSIDDKKYIALSVRMDEIGRMLGGWNGQLSKRNSPGRPGEK